MTEIDSAIQYGALGILALVVFTLLQIFRAQMARANKGEDRVVASINKLADSIADAAGELKQLVFSQEKLHAIVLARIEESAKETRHNIKGDIQMLINIFRMDGDQK